ncbi:MAG TPA: galactokinase, partial [Chitinophagaceae bacterium]|nr:galactokinase [Chitinophagaceae bacterium]
MKQNEIAIDIADKFKNLYDAKPLIVCSPGRVNVIGEHTDYNEGFVLPAAIDKAIYVAISKRNDELIRLFSADFNDVYEGRLSMVEKSEKHWANYILGIVNQLQMRGQQLHGFNLVIGGDVPIGAGLSSSAAIECATAFAINELFQLKIDKFELVKMAQLAEHAFAGVKVGIMDMFASVFGKKDNALKLDCRSLDFEYIPLKMEGIKILLLNTNVEHSLASSEYNTRRQQCERGVEYVKAHHPEVKSLRDITIEMLDRFVAPKDDLIYRRCKYVIEENIRLLAACDDLKKGNIAALGKKMFQTHEGLSKQYEVSCKELDFLVTYVKNNPAVLGARMMGGGFGGCTINLVKEEAIHNLIN